MPMYVYKCHSCGQYWEELGPVSSVLNTVYCTCGALAERQLTMPAFTPRKWGDSHPKTVFGQEVYNYKQEDEILDKKGLVRVEDLHRDWYDTKLDSWVEQNEIDTKFDNRVDELISRGVDEATAVANTIKEQGRG